MEVVAGVAALGAIAGAGVTMALLTVNSGSSSLKLGIYQDSGTGLLLAAEVDGIGSDATTLKLSDPSGNTVSETKSSNVTVQDAFSNAISAMQQRVPDPLTAIGHRIVHGGPHLTSHQRLTKRVLQVLRNSVHFAPLHIPPALDLVRHVEAQFPGLPEFACFDTVFHQTMPPEAYTYAIPKPYRDAGVRRYGFHGLSYESIVHALGDAVPARTVVAHLGSGASICALLQRKSVATSMGVSPTGGLVMSTRTGDLDPGVALLLERTLAPGIPVLSPDDLEKTFNRDSGMKALASDGDMRKLLARADRKDADAALAITIFCSHVAQQIAAYAVVLGGIDLLVFTGGIGEHSTPIRQKVCERLAIFGIALAPNAASSGVVSTKDSLIAVRVMTADENAMIALHVAALQN